jgi:hypothetical protein
VRIDNCHNLLLIIFLLFINFILWVIFLSRIVADVSIWTLRSSWIHFYLQVVAATLVYFIKVSVKHLFLTFLQITLNCNVLFIYINIFIFFVYWIRRPHLDLGLHLHWRLWGLPQDLLLWLLAPNDFGNRTLCCHWIWLQMVS